MGRLERVGGRLFGVDEVLNLTIFDKNHSRDESVMREFGDFKVRMNSFRYQTFKKKGVKCVCCGIEGQYFALERSRGCIDERPHFNLYALTEDGKERLMTKDHIVPKSKGGPTHLSNLQPMCVRCNNKKGNGDAPQKTAKVQIKSRSRKARNTSASTNGAAANVQAHSDGRHHSGAAALP